MSCIYINPKTKDYEKPPGMKDLIDFNKDSREVEIHPDAKIMKTFFRTPDEIFFSQLKEKLHFNSEKNSCWNIFCREFTNTTIADHSFQFLIALTDQS